MNIKENLKNKDTWIRGLFILLFSVILCVLFQVLWLLVAIHFLTQLIAGKINDNLGQLSANLSRYFWHIINYITFQVEERPFPFTSWEETKATQSPITKKKTSRKKAPK